MTNFGPLIYSVSFFPSSISNQPSANLFHSSSPSSYRIASSEKARKKPRKAINFVGSILEPASSGHPVATSPRGYPIILHQTRPPPHTHTKNGLIDGDKSKRTKERLGKKTVGRPLVPREDVRSWLGLITSPAWNEVIKWSSWAINFQSLWISLRTRSVFLFFVTICNAFRIVEHAQN